MIDGIGCGLLILIAHIRSTWLQSSPCIHTQFPKNNDNDNNKNKNLDKITINPHEIFFLLRDLKLENRFYVARNL